MKFQLAHIERLKSVIMDFLKQDHIQEVDESTSELHLMDMSTKISLHEEDGSNWYSTEKEHMFDKVVTPSDVGKLNRLVIPKQYAEKYFPLDSSKNEKDLILNFEDRIGKRWRFRYSFWNSSQSYVMTKGWSRFVKDKTLHAGDTVSFQRSFGKSGKDHVMYIDWRRRALHFHNNHQQEYYFCQPADHNRFYSVLPLSIPILSQQHFQYLHFNPSQNFQTQAEIGGHNRPIGFEVEAVNVGYIGKSSISTSSTKYRSSKRLRLFGVNMEYHPTEEKEPDVKITMEASSSIQRLQNDSYIPRNTVTEEFCRKAKSLLHNCHFDLDS